MSESDYEPAILETAWREFQADHIGPTTSSGYIAFRAGYRRGFAQGSLMALTTHFHLSERPSDGRR